MIKLKIKKTNSKKALSDIVSYVLLIVIAISLSVGVYSFLNFYIPKDREKCSDETAISIEDYNCIVSDDSKILELQVKNRGVFNLEGFYIRVSNSTGTPTTMLNPTGVDLALIIQPGRYDFFSPLKPTETATIRFDYGLNLDTIKRLQLQPIVKGTKNQTLLCSNIADINLENC